MDGGVSRGTEKEPELAQQEAHMEENREKHGSQGDTKLMMETDTDKSINPETNDVGKLRNPTPTLPPCDPAQSEHGPCDLTTKEPDTSVGSEQLSTAGRLAPEGPGPWYRAVRPDRAREEPTCSGEPRDGTAADNHGVGPLGLHLPDLPHPRPDLPPQGKASGEAQDSWSTQMGAPAR